MSGATADGARGRRKEQVGTVVSDKMAKTRVVRVERRYRHPVFGKEIRAEARFHAHDEAETSRAGDRVRIVETRPLSRLKRWRVVEVLARGAAAGTEAAP